MASTYSLASCTTKMPLDEQLKTAFSNHLHRLAPTAALDSIHVLWSTPVNERLARIIDDTVYVREYNRIKWQLANARAKNDRDSLAFYRYEIRVMEREIDSISKAIPQGDTTHQYGDLIACSYFLRKDGRAFSDSTLIYLDSAHALRYTAFLDSSLARSMTSH